VADPASSVAGIVLQTLLWSGLATCLILVPGVLMAYALARFEFLGKKVIATLVSLPLVLPPTAAGYLLLRLLADGGPLGGLEILLTWKAVVVACSFMSFPLFVRTARVGFEAVDVRLERMARTLGMGPWKVFFLITLPLARRGLMAAGILGFTRALGEFGATIVIAGNIPGQTRTLSTAIYSAQQGGNEALANGLLVVALLIGFGAVLLTEYLTQPGRPAGKEGSR